jgi:hypothetical protein
MTDERLTRLVDALVAAHESGDTKAHRDLIASMSKDDREAVAGLVQQRIAHGTEQMEALHDNVESVEWAADIGRDDAKLLVLLDAGSDLMYQFSEAREPAELLSRLDRVGKDHPRALVAAIFAVLVVGNWRGVDHEPPPAVAELARRWYERPLPEGY